MSVGVQESSVLLAMRKKLEAKVAATPWDKACRATFDKFGLYCKSRHLLPSHPTYHSVSSFLLNLVLERKGSTASIHNDLSQLKCEMTLQKVEWLSQSDRRTLTRLVAKMKKEDVRAIRRAAAFRDPELKATIASMNLNDPVQHLQAMILATGKEALLRSGEIAPDDYYVRAEDVSFGQTSTGLKIIHLDLQRTKTHREGGVLRVTVADYAHPHSMYKLVKSFKERFNLHAHPQAPMFPRIRRGKLYWDKGVTYDSIRLLVKTAAARLGMDDSLYSGHSLRAGGATDLFAAGMRYELIKKAGRWKSDTAMLYYRSDEDVVLAMNTVYQGFANNRGK